MDPSETLTRHPLPSLGADSLLSSNDSSFLERKATDSAWDSCPSGAGQGKETNLKGLLASSLDKTRKHHRHYHRSSLNRKRADVRSGGGRTLACKTSFLI